ncbi:hypothetical protein B0T25DRAFT_517151 [Lasiosphaeria hispida]|uniref:Uncharacterized protein n=1 Tax=Lasiosphaeria hispida TaxID=260671 RepID=A0AAJ0HND5_9PEZI|nr:hypothetical protein B0T25DRAFT_517151 [Lasiosphaeria hispida]
MTPRQPGLTFTLYSPSHSRPSWLGTSSVPAFTRGRVLNVEVFVWRSLHPGLSHGRQPASFVSPAQSSIPSSSHHFDFLSSFTVSAIKPTVKKINADRHRASRTARAFLSRRSLAVSAANPANMSDGKRAGVGAGAGVGTRVGPGAGEGVDAGEGLGIVGVDVRVASAGAGASPRGRGFDGVDYGASRNRSVTAPAWGPGQVLRREFLRPPSRAHARPISRDAYRATLDCRAASPGGPGLVSAPVPAPAPPRKPAQFPVLRDNQQHAQSGLQSFWPGSPDSFSGFYPAVSAGLAHPLSATAAPLAAAFSSGAPAQLYDEPGANQRGFSFSGLNPIHNVALARGASFHGTQFPPSLAELAQGLPPFRPLPPPIAPAPFTTLVPRVAPAQLEAPPPRRRQEDRVPWHNNNDQLGATSSALAVVPALPVGPRGLLNPPCTREHFRTPSGQITHGFPPGYHKDNLRGHARNLSICQNPASYPIGPATVVTRHLAAASVRGPGGTAATTMQVARRVPVPTGRAYHAPDHTNCSVWFYGLPGDITLAELLDAVAAHRPGRVFTSSVVLPRPDAVSSFPGGVPSATGQVTFFTRQGFDALLKATNAAGGLQVPGRSGPPLWFAGARPNRQRYVPLEAGSFLHSRVIVVVGPAGIVNRRNLEAAFRRQIESRWETVRVVEGCAGDQACLEWHFAGWRGQAETALGVVKAWFGAEGVQCYWGADPCGFV